MKQEEIMYSSEAKKKSSAEQGGLYPKKKERAYSGLAPTLTAA